MRRAAALRARPSAAARRPSAGQVALAAALALLAACAGTPEYAIPAPIPNRYDYLDPAGLEGLRAALALREVGRIEDARMALGALAHEWPTNVPVGAWLQEVELELAIARFPADGESAEEAEGALRAEYRARADVLPSPTALVLAGRIEPDLPSARRLLEQAVALDEGCVPALHGLAHVRLREGDYEAARRVLGQALEGDPSHLPSVRLHGWMLLQAGRREQAIPVLRAFLEASADDPRIPASWRAATRLDVAVALLADGQAEEAEAELEELSIEHVEVESLLGARIAIEAQLGRPAQARAQALAAQELDPTAVLPAVQEALLLEQYLGEPEAARRAWERVLERFSADEDLGDLLQRLRAEVHRLRLERDLGPTGERR